MLLVAGVLIGGAYYIGTLKNKPQTQNPVVTSQTPQPTIIPQTTSTPSSIPSPTPDKTTDWKTYTHGLYGFSFKYPQLATVTLTGQDQSLPDLLATVTINFNNTAQNNEPDQTIRVWSTPKTLVTDSATRDQWCAALQNELTTTQLDCNFNGKLPEVQVNGQKAFIYYGGRNNNSEEILYIPHNVYVYQIELAKWITNGTYKYVDIQDTIPDQILSTFKFIQ